MNVKRRQQGLGYYQASEQARSETDIMMILMDMNEKDKKLDNPNDVLKHNWISIRGLVRKSGLHHVTVRKAIDRMKQKGQILELEGSRNSCLFCISDGEKGEHIRKHLNKFPKIHELNSSQILNNSEFHSVDRKQQWVFKKHHERYDDNSLWSDRDTKRQTIQIANKRRWHALKGKNRRIFSTPHK